MDVIYKRPKVYVLVLTKDYFLTICGIFYYFYLKLDNIKSYAESSLREGTKENQILTLWHVYEFKDFCKTHGCMDKDELIDVMW